MRQIWTIFLFILMFGGTSALFSCQEHPITGDIKPGLDTNVNCCPTGGNNGGIPGSSNSIRTYTSEDWDYWEIKLEGFEGTLRTYTSEDWDYWELYLNGEKYTIRTYTSEDWDHWEISSSAGTKSLRTYTSEDWDYWECGSVKIRTYTSEDWDYWECGSIKIRTYTSEDWDYWTVSGSLSGLSAHERVAVIFVPVFTSIRLNVL